MLMAHPQVLKNLIEQYESLRMLPGESINPEIQQRIEDVTYTLCVCTGTRDIETALTTARDQLSRTLPAAEHQHHELSITATAPSGELPLA